MISDPAFDRRNTAVSRYDKYLLGTYIKIWLGKEIWIIVNYRLLHIVGFKQPVP